MPEKFILIVIYGSVCCLVNWYRTGSIGSAGSAFRPVALTQFFELDLHAYGMGKFHLWLTWPPPFGGDQHNSCGCTCPIDGCCGCSFQYLNTFNVFGIEVGDPVRGIVLEVGASLTGGFGNRVQ